MGISTKLRPSADEDAFMTDKDLANNKAVIDSDIAKIKATGKTVVFPKDGLGTGLAALKTKAPQTYAYLKERLLQEFGFNNDSGTLNQPSTQPTVEPVTQPTTSPIQETIPTLEEAPEMVMMPDNIAKIASGEKTTTLRTTDIADGIYRIGDNLYRLTNRGLLSIEEAGGVDIISKSEAFGPEGPKFPSTKDFLAGNRKLYVINIEPVQQPQVEQEIEEEESYIDVNRMFSGYADIERFYMNLRDYEMASGEIVTNNLPTLEEAIEMYQQMYEDTMSAQEYIDNVLKCKM
jgi:hypothetical protein